MPLPSVHFLLARIPLRRWSLLPTQAPFDAADPEARNAYFHGALGPDMGIFPGGEPILSELAHHVQAKELMRTLAVTARTDVQRAFACGWATHLLADEVLHPEIDRFAAHLLAGETGDTSDPDRLVHAHVRAELGLDIFVHARDAELRALRLRPCFDSLSIGYLASAYEATYAVSFDRKTLLRSHRVVGPLAAALGLLERLHARAPSEGAARYTLASIRRICGNRISRRSAAFLTPVHPPCSLLSVLSALQHRFANSVNVALQPGQMRAPGLPPCDATTIGMVHSGGISLRRSLQREAAEQRR